ncbi:MAG TPA: tetratricopeptide repeat protein, partial [Ktedonobacteraceae bacterium]|nr:tetratricopeptide repeat protein [Ktedonobacteraceae bacterium]
NPNPYDGEPYYYLGLTLRYLGRDTEAYAAFYKSAWNQACQSTAYLALAELDAKAGRWESALEHLQNSLRMNSENLNARNLSVVVLRKLGREAEADRCLQPTRAMDKLDIWSRYLHEGTLPSENQLLLDLALDYARAGLYKEATEVLGALDKTASDGSLPIVLYALAYFHELLGNAAHARRFRTEAASAPPDYCFPNRLEELLILESALAADPQDGRAAYYLGNLLYDRRRHREALAHWEKAVQLHPSFPVAWRNLGIGYFNILGDAAKARAAFDRALSANPKDARVLYERDQLWKRIGDSPQHRLAELAAFPELTQLRDDLSVEMAMLYNQTGQPEKALALLQSRRFQPWEGGEGLVRGQHVRAHLALGRKALLGGQAPQAVVYFEKALSCPMNLGEATHLLANQSDIDYLLGLAHEASGDLARAKQSWMRAAKHKGDFQEMSVKSFSEMTYFQALALKKLGHEQEAATLLHSLLTYAEELATRPVKIDYFATSLPAMLLFDDDLQKRNTVTALFLQAQARLGLGELNAAMHLLRQVENLDSNHPFAGEMLAELESSHAN